MFDDYLVRKEVVLDYKIWDITKLPRWDFFIGVKLTHDFGQKLQISFSFAFFGEISLEIKSDDHLVKNQALSQSTVLAI